MNEDKHLSIPGAQYLKQLEEPGGRCRLKAYDDGTGTPTIAWGCTHGVYFGMTITEDQGVVMFDMEIRGIEDGLRKWLSREVDQDTWDYCVMFGYNLGWGKCQAFKTAVNGGDAAKIRAAAMLFTHARSGGKVVEWPGLVSRRKQELAYWDSHHNLAPTPSGLPIPIAVDGPKSQALAPPKPSVATTAASSRSVRAGFLGLGAIVGVVRGWWNDLLGTFSLPAADAPQDFVSDAQDHIETTKQVVSWFNLNPEQLALWIALGVIAYMIARRVLDKREQQL